MIFIIVLAIFLFGIWVGKNYSKTPQNLNDEESNPSSSDLKTSSTFNVDDYKINTVRAAIGSKTGNPTLDEIKAIQADRCKMEEKLKLTYNIYTLIESVGSYRGSCGLGIFRERKNLKTENIPENEIAIISKLYFDSGFLKQNISSDDYQNALEVCVKHGLRPRWPFSSISILDVDRYSRNNLFSGDGLEPGSNYPLTFLKETKHNFTSIRLSKANLVVYVGPPVTTTYEDNKSHVVVVLNDDVVFESRIEFDINAYGSTYKDCTVNSFKYGDWVDQLMSEIEVIMADYKKAEIVKRAEFDHKIETDLKKKFG